MTKINWRRVAPALVVPMIALAAAETAAADAPFEFRSGAQSITRVGPEANLGGGRADVQITMALQTEPEYPAAGRPAQGTRRMVFDLPPGLVGDPTAADVCSMDLVLANEAQATVGQCPRSAAVGWAGIEAAYPAGNNLGHLRRRIWRVPARANEAAAFATSLVGVPIRMAATATPSGEYRVRVTGDNLPQAALVRALKIHLWAVPSQHQGDGGAPPVGYDGTGGPADCDGNFATNGSYNCFASGAAGARFGSPLPGAEPKAFMTNGSSCGQADEMGLTLTAWGTIWPSISEQLPLAPLTDCASQPFAPSIAVAPRSREASQPSGYDVTIDVPQSSDPATRATAHVKDVSVTLPRGLAISPPSANGLDACSDAQIDLTGDTPVACPDRSSIGTMTVETPLLEEPLVGRAYLGTQLSKDPMSGDMYRMFLAVDGPGVLVKLKGAVRANPETGQLTATFENNPQVPFNRIKLKLDGGQRAPLANPVCGTHTATATLTSWAGHSRDVSSSFDIDEGCSPGRFQPSFTAGMANPLAGAFSPFSMTVNRTDADQDLSRLNLELPSGLLAALGSVPLCGEADAAAGTCAEASRIGSTSVLVGSGAEPLPLSGTVYVTGPYKGAPFGLSVVVPAKVGPFDLGDVVVRGQLQVDANNAKATAVTDPFPTIVGGVPVRLRQVSVSMDRPGFTFNATSCAQQSVNGGFWSTDGATATASVPYQAQGCDQLRIQPRLALQWVGKTQMAQWKHPGLKAQLGDMLGQANLKKVKVTLPLSAALDPDNAKALCQPEQAAARNCPAESIVGEASASTPALHERVSGPVYFVKGVRYSETGRAISTLPKLWVPLSGQGVTVDLWADSFVDSKKRLQTTFTNVPDVPVRDFQMEINGGENGVLKATQNVCAASKTTTIEYSGHNGGVTQQRVAFTAPDCKPQIVEAKNSRNKTLAVRVGGIGPGTLTLTGRGIGKGTRKIVRSDNGLVKATFTKAARHQLLAGKAVRTRLTVRFQPAKGKAINIRKTVRIASVRR